MRSVIPLGTSCPTSLPTSVLSLWESGLGEGGRRRGARRPWRIHPSQVKAQPVPPRPADPGNKESFLSRVKLSGTSACFRIVISLKLSCDNLKAEVIKKFLVFSSSTDSDESCSIDEDITVDSRCSPSKDSTCSETVNFEDLFPTMKTVYGVEPEEPKKANVLIYKR